MITISYYNKDNECLASVTHETEANLYVEGSYREGDYFVFSGARHMMVRPDVTLLFGEIFTENGSAKWLIPCGEHRLAYAPGAFIGDRHVIQAREMTREEILSVRNIACNPADLRGDTDFYPHCTANVETRGESDFAARNVIDGQCLNFSHGYWPFGSWGVGAREDAYCTLDFGRLIRADRMALILRADFPHDAYWTHGHMVDSNGDEIEFDLCKTAERQYIDLGGRQVRWLRLERMTKSDDPSAFPSLNSWEVYGTDLSI